jgi:hypothetical protein
VVLYGAVWDDAVCVRMLVVVAAIVWFCEAESPSSPCRWRWRWRYGAIQQVQYCSSGQPAQLKATVFSDLTCFVVDNNTELQYACMRVCVRTIRKVKESADLTPLKPQNNK